MAGFAYDTWGDSWGAAWGNSWGKRASNRNTIDGRGKAKYRKPKVDDNEAIIKLNTEAMIRAFYQ